MFYADLHVHSRFSRATSRDCDLEHLAIWADKKGISVVGTGDFTHPGWFEEIQGKLTPAEPGLYRLQPAVEKEIAERLGRTAPNRVRFMLQVEISTIYKKDGRTRKVHHLIYAPEMEHARRLSQSLARIGNIASDGRPILGLDSRDLLEIVLESGEGCYLVPAHIWTPWFSVFGSQSGFDSIEHCYGDLSSEIFALETGLSSDPGMNWRVSALDRYALISNSDAHSPPKLGREACVFDVEPDYFAMRRALQSGEGYLGTVEFFPEEGKYHFDGHRKCGVCLSPDETRRHNAQCPVCGKQLTLGVMYRVCELADRTESPAAPPGRAVSFRSRIPLEEILAEVYGVGPQSNTVQRKYEDLLARLGPELFILDEATWEDISRAALPLLAEAIARMRAGRVIRQAGFDGQYGVIRLFSEEELRRGTTVGLLFRTPEEVSPRPVWAAQNVAETACTPKGSGVVFHVGEEDVGLAVDRYRRHGKRLPTPFAGGALCPSPPNEEGSTRSRHFLDELDPEQRAAAEAIDGPVLIVAGPGTGKTRTLTHRIAHLVADCGAPPEQCLALTFSRRAASEMSERLERLLPGVSQQVPVMTFHRLGLSLLREHGQRVGLPSGWRVAGDVERAELLAQTLSISPSQAARLLRRISQHKRGGNLKNQDGLSSLGPEDADAMDRYQQELRQRGWLDFDDLIALPLEVFKGAPDVLGKCRLRYRWISVDEFQDIDRGQYDLVRLLVPADGNLCAIGDPDQAIYGFRGADPRSFERLREDYPGLRTIALARNYRSTQTIVDAALQAVAPASMMEDRRLEAGLGGAEKIEVHACTTDRAEAELVVHTIERMLGGWSFFSLDSGRAGADEAEELSFADFAVLYRTEGQADLLVEALQRSGIPFQRRCHDRLLDRPSVRSLVDAMAAVGQDGPAGQLVLQLLDRAAQRLSENGDKADESSLAALRIVAARHTTDLAQFLSELALGADVDLWDPRADRLSLLTLHAAKGLEFSVVFIVGCEDGLLPLHWGDIDQAGEDEERRLLFVGMTRARQRLILTHARKRHWRGSVRVSTPSPFLAAIERALVAMAEHRSTRKPASPNRQGMLFES